MEKEFIKLEKVLSEIEIKTEEAQISSVMGVSKGYSENREYGCWFTCKCDPDCICDNQDCKDHYWVPDCKRN